MIYGVGIDIVRIERLRNAYSRWGRRFLEKAFTEAEMSYCLSKKDPYPSLAVRFAAKEALIKAIGGEIPVSLKDIEVISLNSGKPTIMTKGGLKAFMDKAGITAAHISLSHEKDYAVACVVFEKAESL